jgi:DNA-binding SARP family transcriptional activator
MWFGLIGPLLVRHDDVAVIVPAAKQRILLAALLLAPGSVVSSARLTELAWNGEPPAGAAVTLRSYIGRLRRALGPAGQRIVTADHGYLINVAEDEVDLPSYARLCGKGEAALRAGCWQEAVELLDEAERLWRGSPLSDIPCQALQDAEVHPLEQLRQLATQWQVEADLQLGHFSKVVPQLYALTAEHPLLEPFHYQLMIALYRSGRKADALAAYRQARGVLVREIGFEPGPELQLLHQRILAGDADLAAPAGPLAAAAPPPAAVPRQLPSPAANFVGRTAELDHLTALLEAGTARRGTVIALVTGAAGVGKTTLALRWAHQVAASFPDGQIFLNLNGFGPSGPPVTEGEAVTCMLEALQVSAAGMPATHDGRVGLYRTLLSQRRMLIVLDNAKNADQVRALLPGGGGCVVVITSRSPLPGLIALDDARGLTLAMLTEAEARPSSPCGWGRPAPRPTLRPPSSSSAPAAGCRWRWPSWWRRWPRVRACRSPRPRALCCLPTAGSTHSARATPPRASGRFLTGPIRR